MTFEELYTKYRNYVKKSAYSVFHNEEKAEDASQDFFMWLHTNLAGYRPEKGTFKKWFVANMKFSFLNTRKKSFTNKSPKPLDNLTDVENLESLVSWCKSSKDEDIREVLNKAATKIKPRELLILQRCLLEGESLADLARELNVSREFIRQQHSLAVSKLRNLLE